MFGVLAIDTFIYTVHRCSHWLARWRLGRRVCLNHLRHHSQHYAHYPYTRSQILRQASELMFLIMVRNCVESTTACTAVVDTTIWYKLAHSLQHVLPPGTPIHDHHRLHHRYPNTNLGILSPLLDVLTGNLHPSHRLLIGWRLLLLPFPILGFWALATTTTAASP